MLVDLGEYWGKIVDTGERRNEVNSRRGSRNYKVGRQGNVEIHICGVAGEVAVRLELGLPLDPVWNVQQRGKWPEVDGEWNGKSYQVKTPTKPYGRMLYNNKFMNLKAELYFLVVPLGGTTVRIVGWLTREEVKKKLKEEDLGYGPVQLVEQEDFYPIESLIQ